MRVSVIIFPGSNCDHDVLHAFGAVLGHRVTPIWHRDTDLAKPDLVVLPGGFSYGDYLRTGALAKVSPALREVNQFASKGGGVIGICNGFQILCEAGMLPGALLQNVHRRFLSQFVHLRVEQSNSLITREVPVGSVITCPIAHGEGNFFADSETIQRIEDQGQVVLRYCSERGEVDEQSREINPNGSAHSIAGLMNPKGNVVGLMPHPERSIEALVGFIGGASGKPLLAAASLSV